LEPVFRALVAHQNEAAWIAWSVPAVRGPRLGCEFVNGEGQVGAGVVHLEPPDHAIVMLRVAANAVERIRLLSPDCEIDAGGVSVHWLTGVSPAQSIALLAGYANDRNLSENSAVAAIAIVAGPAADSVLDGFAAPSEPEALRNRAMRWLGSARGRHGLDTLKNLLASETAPDVRRHAIAAIGASREPEAQPLMLSTARGDRDPRVRAEAVSQLSRGRLPNLAAVLGGIAENDPDSGVWKRAVGSLASLSDGSGIPELIRLAKSSKSPDVRKEAVRALGRAHDQRAEAFLEEVLR
jgi:HEAT repeat protein